MHPCLRQFHDTICAGIGFDMDRYSRSHNMSETKADRLAARLFFVLAVLFVGFIAIASLTPINNPNVSPRQISDGWFGGWPSWREVFSYHDLRDISTNVLLYLPLGVFLSLAVARRRKRFLPLWLAVGTAVSLSMEFIQAYVGRHPDPVDIATNSTGYLLGFGMVVVAVKHIGLRPSAFLGIGAGRDLEESAKAVASLRFLYICIYFIVALVPFDISVRLSQVYAQLFDGDIETRKIILDPLHHFGLWWGGGGLRLLLHLLGLVPLAILTSLLDMYKRRSNPLSPILACLLLAFLSECSQLFVLSRTSDIVMLPLAVLAGWLGWKLVQVWWKVAVPQSNYTLKRDVDNSKILGIAIAFYAVIICLLTWAPFQFEYHPDIVIDKIRFESNLIPFKLHFAVRDIGSAVDLVKEAGIFVPLGLLITMLLLNLRSRLDRVQIIVLAGMACAGFAVFTELSQAACVGRYIDATDIVLAGIGGMAGSSLVKLFSRS
jgi:glycopeptide antibiotics resistance protein